MKKHFYYYFLPRGISSVVFICLTILSASSAFGQFTKLGLAISHSRLTYVFSVTNEEVKYICNKDRNLFGDTLYEQKLFSNVIDSFPYESNKPPALKPGNYIMVSANENGISSHLSLINDLNVIIVQNYDGLALKVLHNDGSLVKDARVTFGNSTLTFDTALQTYHLYHCRRQGVLFVEENDKINVYRIQLRQSRSRSYWTVRKIFLRPFYRISAPIRRLVYRIRTGEREYWRSYGKYRGYIAFNKPEYLPGDTVKLKAFMVTRKGKAVSKPLTLTLEKGYNDVVFKKVIRPVTKGNYEYQFVPGDSLQIDDEYTVYLKKGKKTETENKFYLKDYQLKEATYRLSLPQEKYYSGQPAIFTVGSHDANGLPIFDGKLQLLLLSDNIDNFYPKSIYVPDTLYAHTYTLSATGQMDITVPDSVFPEAELRVMAKAYFTNSNGEAHDTSFTFYADKKKRYALLRLKDSLVEASYHSGNAQVEGSGLLTAFSMYPYHVLYEQKIKLPSNITLNPLAASYTLASENDIASLSLTDSTPGISCGKKRTADSVWLWFQNTRGLSVNYQLYRNSERVKKGITKTGINYACKDKSGATYTLLISYNWAGEEKSEESVAALFDKELTVNITQPPVVRPGDTVPVKINVTDIKGKPVSHVDITALSINSQFDKDNIPNLPYMGKLKHGKYIQERYEHIEKADSDILLSLNGYWFKRMKLDTQLYYKFINPGKTIVNFYDSTGLDKAQVAPHIFFHAWQSPVYYMRLDNRPIYFSGNYSNSRYSFIATPGYHSLYIRTVHESYTLDSVLLKKGYKLEIAINGELPNPDRRLHVDKIKKPYLTQAEQKELGNTLLPFNYTFVDRPVYFWDSSSVFIQKNYQGGIYFLGPFKPFSQLNIGVRDGLQKQFTFQPGYYYDFSTDYLKLTSYNIQSYLKSNIFSFSYSSPKPPLGELAYTQKDIVLMGPLEPVNPFVEHLPESTDAGNGTLKYRMAGDSSLYAVILSRDGNKENQWILNPDYDKINDLAPGYYQLIFINKHGFYFTADSLHVLANQTLCVNFDGLNFRLMDTSKESYKKLFIPSNIYNYLHGYSMGFSSLKGRIIDEKSNEGIPFAIVVLEDRAGTAVIGAMTNAKGDYALDNLKEGYYNVKISSVGYGETYVNNVEIRGKQAIVRDFKLKAGGLDLKEVTISSRRLSDIVNAAASINTLTYNWSQPLYDLATVRSSANYAVALTGGVAQSDIGDGLGIAGSRSNSQKYVVDGIPVTGTIGLPSDAARNESDLDPFRGNAFLGDSIKPGEKLRSRFTDCAYWQPRLRTDKNGNAAFIASFPDNSTSWNSYALAMDGRHHSGSGYAKTKAVKPLIASLELPRFLVTGDRSLVIGKVLNYTPKPKLLQTHFIVGGQVSSTIDTIVATALIQSFPIEANGLDSVKTEFGFKLKDILFADGEKRSIPVFPAGIELSKGLFCILNYDTTFTYTPNIGYGQTTIYATTEPVQMLLTMIDNLKNYPYNCNEQLASKLIACLLEEQIDSALNKNFKSEGLIKQIVHRLNENQNTDGSWGWWKGSAGNLWMTDYVLHALNKAIRKDYYIAGLYKAERFIFDRLSDMNNSDLVTSLSVLSEKKTNLDFANLIKKIPYDSLDFNEKLLVEKIKVENNLPVDSKIILDKKKTTAYNTYYWQDDSKDWFNNDLKTTALAYQVLKHDAANYSLLPGIRNYLLANNTGNSWGNTFTTALVLETLVPDMLSKFTGSPTTLKVNNESVTSFPVKKIFSNTAPLAISKRGSSPVYLSVSQQYWNSNPGFDSSLFVITTSFSRQGGQSAELQQGQPAVMLAKVEVKKQADYIMIQIPIPAGCSYGDNSITGLPEESHREYFKDRVVIFYEKLYPGSYTIKINLEPRFSGKYTLNPAKAELMYYPVLGGNNQLKIVGIK